MQLSDIIPKLPRRAFSRDSGIYREEVGALGEGIYYDHDRVVTI
jgi:hypothetical protein